MEVRTTTLWDKDYGLSDDILDNTDVLIWWGHMLHSKIPNKVSKKVTDRVLKGMGAIFLHSAHHSKPFKMLMGTSCNLKWRDETYERVFCISPSHPVAAGIPEHFELGEEECYGEMFDIPTPEDVICLSWFDIGEVFRSVCTYKRGYGKIVYIQPGHETNRSFENQYIRHIIKNSVLWTHSEIKAEKLVAPRIANTLEDLRKGKAQGKYLDM